MVERIVGHYRDGPGDHGVSGTWERHGELKPRSSDYSLVPTYDEYAVVNGTKNTRWSYPGGKWEVQSPLDQASAEIISDWAADNFSTVLNGLASPKVVIDIPANTSYVMVNGSTDTFQGTYYVDIEPKQYNYLYPAKLNQPTGSGSSYYIAPHTMAMTSLDPTVKYNMTIAGATGSSNTIVISGVKYWAGVTNSTWPDFSPINNTVVIHDPGKTKANTAAIAGGVVGGVLGGAVIATIAWFWYRKRARTKYSEDPNFVIDEGPEPSLQPFLQDDSRGVTASKFLTGTCTNGRHEHDEWHVCDSSGIRQQLWRNPGRQFWRILTRGHGLQQPC